MLNFRGSKPLSWISTIMGKFLMYEERVLQQSSECSSFKYCIEVNKYQNTLFMGMKKRAKVCRVFTKGIKKLVLIHVTKRFGLNLVEVFITRLNLHRQTFCEPFLSPLSLPKRVRGKGRWARTCSRIKLVFMHTS